MALAEPSVLAAIGLAACAACGFAASTSLQHRAASTAPATIRSFSATFRYVLQRPSWLVGTAAGAVAVTLHALALRFGAIAVVQPIMVAGVVVAVVTREALNRRIPTGHELAGVCLTAAGVAAFLVTQTPQAEGAQNASNDGAVVVAAGIAVAVTLACLATRISRPGRQAMLLGASAGVCFGLTAGLLKVIATGLPAVHGPTVWALGAVAVVGPCGLVINQRAYRVAPLSQSMPMVNVVDVLVAIGFGWLVLGDVPAHNTLGLFIQAAALFAMAAGLRKLARFGDAPAMVPESAGVHAVTLGEGR